MATHQRRTRAIPPAQPTLRWPTRDTLPKQAPATRPLPVIRHRRVRVTRPHRAKGTPLRAILLAKALVLYSRLQITAIRLNLRDTLPFSPPLLHRRAILRKSTKATLLASTPSLHRRDIPPKPTKATLPLAALLRRRDIRPKPLATLQKQTRVTPQASLPFLLLRAISPPSQATLHRLDRATLPRAKRIPLPSLATLPRTMRTLFPSQAILLSLVPGILLATVQSQDLPRQDTRLAGAPGILSKALLPADTTLPLHQVTTHEQ